MASTAAVHRLPLICAAVATASVVCVAVSGRPQAPAASPQGFRETIPNTLVAFDMVPVPGGTVTIEGAAVTVEPFLIGRTEVTWDMYDVFALGLDTKKAGGVDAVARPSQPYGAPDYNWGHAGFPAISVTHQAAQAFCTWLSASTGRTYRLPTEAEWLHAARLAVASAPESRDAITWHRGNAKGTTHAVGSRKPDALGLFDLFGNAAEWVAAAGGARVTRGGSFRDPLDATGPSARAPYDAAWQDRDPQLPKSSWWLSDGPFVGFRIVTAMK